MGYCPDCCDPLGPQSKKFGSRTKWLVCSKCGYRKRPKHWVEESQEVERFCKRRDEVNNLWQNEDE